MSGSRWVIIPLWLSGSWRSFLYSSSVYSCHLFLISFASVRSIPFLSFIEPIFACKCSFGISNFLEEISSLSYSVVSLYFFALFTQKGFVISPCYSLAFCIQMGMFPFLLCLSFLIFSQLFVRSPQTTVLPFCISFSWGWFWSPLPVQCYEPLSIVLQALYLWDLIPWIYLSLLLYNHKGFD